MTDSEFQDLVEDTLDQVEEYIENLAQTLDLDADSSRTDNVLNLDFGTQGKVILNSQVASYELWLAAKSGGFHYRWAGSEWQNTRGGQAFSAHFVQVLAEQLGTTCPPLVLVLGG
ncbi:MAG: iron donor protein CyaY [Limnobacter sp.]|nr:iron donor protein CyaY [Limnobacter sp.]